MSSVYLAEDLKLNRKKWAVKEVMIPPNSDHLFAREAEILARLQHPNLPSIVDYFAPHGRGIGYLVMDFIEGMTLERWMLDNKKTNERTRLQVIMNIAIQLCRCLRYLHEFQPEPIIYRDLKPSNVMVDRKHHVYLVDFGIARRFDINKQKDTTRLGTVTFAAPEQLEGKQTDARSDIYSLGALLYYLLTDGQYYNVTRRPLPEGLWPSGLSDLIHKMLAYDRRDRTQSVESVEQRLIDVAMKEGFSERYSIHDRPRQATRANLIEQTVRTVQRTFWFANLSSGAGATYATLSLARALNDWGVPHAVLEYPSNIPELYHLLDGERTCPDRYVFLQHRTSTASVDEWEDGCTTWFPLHPTSFPNTNEGHVREFPRKFAHHISSYPIVLIDDSSASLLTLSEPFMNDHDVLFFVADAHPAKFNHEQSAKRMELAIRLKKSGKEVHFVANRSYSWKGQKQWLDAFPWKPICLLPHIDYRKILQSAYSGKLIQDDPLYLRQNKRAWWPFIRNWIPKSGFDVLSKVK